MKKTGNITIGILAGMGPKSTAPFLDLVIQQCQKQYGAVHDIDYPHIIIYSLPTPFFVNQKIDDNDMEKTISAGLKKLESTGVDFIAMPCNTAHKYFETLENTIDIPLLHIVKATIKNINSNSRKVTLFATRPTIEAGIYQKYLKKSDVELILKENWQQEIDSLIQGIKSGVSEPQLKKIIERLSRNLQEEHIDTVISACTDITPITETMDGFNNIIDSSKALAKETISTWINVNRV